MSADIEQSYAMYSGRAHSRLQEVKPGLISVDGGHKTLQCTLLDHNDAGARIGVSDTDSLPDEFLVISKSEDLCARCQVVWRRGSEIGVSFQHRGTFTDSAEMRRLRRQTFAGASDGWQARPETVTPEPVRTDRQPKKPNSVKRRRFTKLASELVLLGLDPKEAICSAEVKSAYRAEALKKHPDRGGSPQAFQSLTNAYTKLCEACKLAGV